MKKTILLLFTFCCLTVATAQEMTQKSTPTKTLFEKLKTTPASEYDLAVFKMEITALMFNMEIPKKQRKLNHLSVQETEDALLFKMKVTLPTNEISQDKCLELKKKTKELIKFETAASDLFPSLSADELMLIKDRLDIIFMLVSRDNDSLSISC